MSFGWNCRGTPPGMRPRGPGGFNNRGRMRPPFSNYGQRGPMDCRPFGPQQGFPSYVDNWEDRMGFGGLNECNFDNFGPNGEEVPGNSDGFWFGSGRGFGPQMANSPPMAMPRGGFPRLPPFPGGHGMTAAGPPQRRMMSPPEILSWLNNQDPIVIRRVMIHCRGLLTRMGCELGDKEGDETLEGGGGGDLNSWYENEPVGGGSYGKSTPDGADGPPSKKPRHPGFGRNRGNNGATDGWGGRENSYKVTTTMKPLPETEIIPPVDNSATYPEAAVDRDKLQVLAINVNIMAVELNKICRKWKIQNLDRENISQYPEEAQGRLKTVIQCLAAAEKTLNNFKDFLREEKYKEWNQEQKKNREESVKSMIGETPKGRPHKVPTSGTDTVAPSCSEKSAEA